MTEQESVILSININLQHYVEGRSLMYGLAMEKSLQNQLVNAVGQEVVKIDDNYDNLFFHKLLGTPNYEPLRFGSRKMSTVELFCYTQDSCTFDVVEQVLSGLAATGSQMELKGNDQDVFGVLRRGFLIDDPINNAGFNQEKYIYSFTYEIYTYVSELCCE